MKVYILWYNIPNEEEVIYGVFKTKKAALKTLNEDSNSWNAQFFKITEYEVYE